MAEQSIGTFAVADGGRWGNPGGTLSLQWSGNTLQLNTYNNAYMEYSVDITYVAYDGAVVVFSLIEINNQITVYCTS